VRLCASLLPTRTWDFHPLENAHAGQTKQPETRGIPPLPAAVLFLLDFILSGLNPSLFLDIIPDYTIQIKTQDTKH
ncbi:hypothetical protein, partial [Enterocloster clostridioformis]